MILVVAGTGDARDLARRIHEAGFGVWTTVVTEPAALRLREAGLPVRVGRLDAAGFRDLLRETGTRLVVDVSHPFAEEASRQAMTGAREAGVPYVRYERPHRSYDGGDLTTVSSYEEAAREAATRQGMVLLTTGVKTLPLFARHLLGQSGITLAVRLLPRVENLELCAGLGIDPRYILAMQGPFSRELNEALYRHLNVRVLVSKESGSAGAVDEKVQSALELGVQVILIARPQLDYDTVFTDGDTLLDHLRSRQDLEASDGTHLSGNTREHSRPKGGQSWLRDDRFRGPGGRCLNPPPPIRERSSPAVSPSLPRNWGPIPIPRRSLRSCNGSSTPPPTST